MERGTSVNIFEVTNAGLVNLTTIFLASIPTEIGREGFKVVNTRHSIIIGDPLPQELYGFYFPWE